MVSDVELLFVVFCFVLFCFYFLYILFDEVSVLILLLIFKIGF